MGKANEGMYIYRRSCRSLSLMLSCLTVSFSCGVVYSRGNRTPEREKKQTSVYLIKREMKNKFLYVPGTYISPFVVALAAGVNSNPSSRETFFLRTANPRQDPNSCIHYDVIWRYYSSTSTGGRHQVMQQQTGSEPPNRCQPDPLVNTYITHWHKGWEWFGLDVKC